MKRRLVTVLLSGLALTACGGPEVDENAGAEAIAAGDEAPIVGPLWTATNYYTSADEPSALPQTVAGTVNLVFGESSAAGSTGCAEFQADVTFFAGDKETRAEAADHVVIDDIKFRDVGIECSASSREIHDDLVEFFAPEADLGLLRRGATELVVTADTKAVDSPSLRLAAL